MAFEALFKKLSPTLKRICYKLNGHLGYFNDQDLFQEASLNLWREYEAGQLQDKTDSYILQGCYFHLKNYIRTAKARNHLSIDELIQSEDNSYSIKERFAASDPKEFFEYVDSRLLVEKMRNNGLSLKEKEVLALCFEGLTTREIGSRMGVSHVRVVKLKNRIKDRYKNIFSELG